VEPTLKPPIFVLAEDCYRFPLIFVAGTLEELVGYFQDHDGSTLVPEGGIRVTSRFFDLTGRRWSHEGSGGSGGGLVPTEEGVSQQDLRDIVTRGYAELARFELESRDFEQMAVYLANEEGSTLQPEDPEDPTPGPRRHKRWHKAMKIGIKEPH
jgi:hypothetical protein